MRVPCSTERLVFEVIGMFFMLQHLFFMLQHLFVARFQLQPRAGESCTTTMLCLEHILNLSPRTHNGQSAWTTGQPSFPAHHCGGSSLLDNPMGITRTKHRMNRYTIAYTSDFQRCLLPYTCTMMHTAQTIVRCRYI